MMMTHSALSDRANVSRGALTTLAAIVNEQPYPADACWEGWRLHNLCGWLAVRRALPADIAVLPWLVHKYAEPLSEALQNNVAGVVGLGFADYKTVMPLGLTDSEAYSLLSFKPTQNPPAVCVGVTVNFWEAPRLFGVK